MTMTTDQLTADPAVNPQPLSPEQQTRAAALSQARIVLSSRGFGSNSLSNSVLDLLDVAAFILDGTTAVQATLESVTLDSDRLAAEQYDDLADHLLERHGIKVGGPYVTHLADAVVVDLDDLRTVVEYVGRQTRSTDEPMSAAYARLAATVGP